MKLFVFLTLFLLALPSAKLNDEIWRSREAKNFATKDVGKFVQAWTSQPRDNETLESLTESILIISTEGIKHAKTYIKKLRKHYLLLKSASLIPTKYPINALISIIEANRNHEAFYDLETLIQWIDERINAGIQSDYFTSALKTAYSARSHVEKLNGAFVDGMDMMKEHSWTTKRVLNKMKNVLNEHKKPYLHDYIQAHDYILFFQRSLRNNYQ